MTTLRMVQILSLLLGILFFTSCRSPNVFSGSSQSKKDKPNIAIPNVEPACPAEDEVEWAQYLGVQDVELQSPREAIISWVSGERPASYSVFLQKEEEDRKLIATVGANKTSYTLLNLVPGTTYKVFVKMLNLDGMVDNNQNQVTFTIPSFDEFVNQYAMNFNGHKTLNLGASNQLVGSNFSVSLWVKSNQQMGDGRIFNLRTQQDGTSLNLNIQGANLFFGFRDMNHNYHAELAANNFVDGTWHHIVIAKNASRTIIYKDAVEVLRVSDTIYPHGTLNAYLGSYNGSSNFFTGLIDEASFWNATLSKSHVIALYNQGHPGELGAHPLYRKLTQWLRLGDDGQDPNYLYVQDTP